MPLRGVHEAARLHCRVRQRGGFATDRARAAATDAARRRTSARNLEPSGISGPLGGVPAGLGQFGWTIGRNVQVDTRWATANAADIRKHAAELVALAPDVILAGGASTVAPVLQATRTVPIV